MSGTYYMYYALREVYIIRLSVLNNFDSLLPIQFQLFIILNLIVPVETLIKLVNVISSCVLSAAHDDKLLRFWTRHVL